MKKLFISALVAFALTGSAKAQVKIQPVVVSPAPTAAGTNIQVRLSNQSNHAEKLSAVALQVRDDKTGKWRDVKVWNHPATIRPHQDLSLDFRPELSDELQPSPDNYTMRVTYETAER